MKRNYELIDLTDDPPYKRHESYDEEDDWSNVRDFTMLPKEVNYVDSSPYSLFFSPAGTVVPLSVIARGTGVSQRVGKKILLKSLQCRGLFRNPSSDTTENSMLIVYDKRPTGAIPAVTDVLKISAPYSPNNDVNSGRFKILKRLDFWGSPTDQPCTKLDFYMSLRNLPMEFGTLGTGVPADVKLGAMYAVCVGDSSATQTGSVNNIVFRTRFVDV